MHAILHADLEQGAVHGNEHQLEAGGAIEERDGKLDQLQKYSPIFGLSPTTSISRSFNAATRRAGLEGLRFHDLRRIFVNRHAELGTPFEVTMKLTAHTNAETMIQYYRETQKEELQAATRAMDRAKRKGKKCQKSSSRRA